MCNIYFVLLSLSIFILSQSLYRLPVFLSLSHTSLPFSFVLSIYLPVSFLLISHPLPILSPFPYSSFPCLNDEKLSISPSHCKTVHTCFTCLYLTRLFSHSPLSLASLGISLPLFLSILSLLHYLFSSVFSLFSFITAVWVFASLRQLIHLFLVQRHLLFLHSYSTFVVYTYFFVCTLSMRLLRGDLCA